ncbi:MAG: SMI1/KNR4 family protein [Alphaproteobacteria bacterium]|nr:SMI1/KNR4 family protein [Alphaproteobacteria bacterium]MDP3532626.1 SMI1/KNR4 family protein [Alphaproteobacteria bacterium]
MKKVLSFVLMAVIYMQVHATLDQQNVFDSFNAKSRVLKSIDAVTDKLLPTEAECLAVEDIIGEIPSILKQFYLNCGNHVLHGYEMGFVYKGADSSLVKLHEIAKEDDWSIPLTYFPFCRDQDSMYCLDKKNGKVVIFDRFEKQIDEDPKYQWDSFLSWLNSTLG